MKVSDVIEVLNHIHCVDYILDRVMEAQDRFEAQIELQKLCAHTCLYLPADYRED